MFQKNALIFFSREKILPPKPLEPQAIGPNCSDPRGSRCLSRGCWGCCRGAWGIIPSIVGGSSFVRMGTPDLSSHLDKGHLEVQEGGDPSLIFPWSSLLGGWDPRYSRYLVSHLEGERSNPIPRGLTITKNGCEAHEMGWSPPSVMCFWGRFVTAGMDMLSLDIQSYCWWKKPCTTWDI